MEPLDPELRQLIDDGLTAATPDHLAEARGLESLIAHVEAPPVTPTVPSGPVLGKLALVIATVVTAGGTWIASRSEPAPTPTRAGTPATSERQSPHEASPPLEAPKSATPLPPQPTTLAAPIETPSPRPVDTPRNTRPAHKADAPVLPTPADALRAEANLIAKAESALDRNKPKEALALCDFHRTGFDAPQLTTERNAIAASAACMVDRTDTGPAAAFVRAHPRSALATKVRQRCRLAAGVERLSAE